ncbi:MAG: endolytic transglycosylase MltG, partial [Deltaproteobacteria bacterium]|nr:endolytic transglycosylase MltG [Deltaproteobacteria bacterium]
DSPVPADIRFDHHNITGLDILFDPAESGYLFFVSRNDGTHVFSKTYSEHVREVDRFQRKRSR